MKSTARLRAFLNKWLPPLCGWLYLWIVVANMAGELLIRGDGQQDCVPFVTVFGLLNLHCTSSFIEIVFIPVSLARALIMGVYLAIIVVRSGIANHMVMEGLLGSIRWVLWSTPFFLIAIPGFSYWDKKSRFFSVGITLILAILIIHMLL